MLENLKIPRSSLKTCKVDTVLESLNPADQQILTAALANLDWSIKGLSRELGKLGIRISETPLGSHRKADCTCYMA